MSATVGPGNFGERFAPKPEHIKPGFKRVAQTLPFSWLRRRALYRAFYAPLRAGDARAMDKAVEAALPTTDWRWHWMDECAERFDAAGTWPLAWDRLLDIKRPLDWPSLSSRTRARLLSRTLFTSIMAVRRLSEAKTVSSLLRQDLRHGWKGCPAEAAMIARYREPILNGDYTNAPPFFPGDGIGMTVITHKELARERGEA